MRLAEIGAVLSRGEDALTVGREVLASPSAVNAWESFVRGWDDGRDQIEKEIASLQEAVLGAASEYARSEQVVRAGFDAGGERAGGR